jgi:TATA-binding protein-associated factor Taf7
VDALLSSGELESETVLWEGDMRTWLTTDPGAMGGGEGPGRAEEDEDEDEEDEDEGEDEDEEDGRDLLLHCLNATLATFRRRKGGAPPATPPRAQPPPPPPPPRRMKCKL